MQLHRQKLLAGHRVQKAVQAVDNQQLQILLLNQLPDLMNKLTRRKFGCIDLAKGEFSGLNVLLDVESQSCSPGHQCCQSLIEGENRRAATLLDSRHCVTERNGGFSATSGSQ